MALLQPFNAQTSSRAMAGVLSAVLHFAMAALILLSGGRADGVRDDATTPTARMTWLDLPSSERRAAVDRPPVRAPIIESQPGGHVTPAPDESLAERAPAVEFPRVALPPAAPPRVDIPDVEADGLLVVDTDDERPGDDDEAGGTPIPRTFALSAAEASRLLERVEQLASDWSDTPGARISWVQDGQQYHAELVPEPVRDALEPERLVAEVSTEDQGRQLSTSIRLKRLPFSHFAKLIDRWDPMVQLHDDEIVGRMHINSRFKVLYGSQAAPRVAGKVTTAAGGIDLERRGPHRDADVFLEGLEMKAGRVRFSHAVSAFEWSGYRENSRIHHLAQSASIRFLGDAGYAWRERGMDGWQFAESPTGEPVFLVAAPGAAVHVQGTVSGRFLVYSPWRIVVQGDIRYARDPRSEPDSDDYLGLVSELDIEVASPRVTGPGDLHIEAAIYAGRRMIVANADHATSATLSIYGSLAAGTLTESEPRYAMRVEYDRRFDRHRPPGFPSTNRLSLEEWNREWTADSVVPLTAPALEKR